MERAGEAAAAGRAGGTERPQGVPTQAAAAGRRGAGPTGATTGAGPEPHEELEAACRALAQATLDLGWAAYLLGNRPLPGTMRPDPACVRELTGATLDLLLAAREVALLLDIDGALPLLPEFDAWGALARLDSWDVEILDALEVFTSLAGYGANDRRPGHAKIRASRSASTAAEGGRR